MKSDTADYAKLFRGWRALVVLGVVLIGMFFAVLDPSTIIFSNDGPLGAQEATSHSLPSAFVGSWEDLNSIGFVTGAIWNLSYVFQWIVGPVAYAKFLAPFALAVLGLGAWIMFRSFKLSAPACLLGALAACLNSGFFSAATWGVASHAITVGMGCLAVAAVSNLENKREVWLRWPLAGLALGLCVSEGADIGALFSVAVACYIVYGAWAEKGTRGVPRGMLRVAIVALFALFMASQAVFTLVTTSIQGVAGAQQDSQSKEQRWGWATQWSLPKREALSFVIPGLYGYRMDTPKGGNYWGAVGRDPAWDAYFASGKQGQPPQGFLRFTGGTIYAGVMVCLVAFWAIFQALRKSGSVFDPGSRKRVLFWAGLMFVCLLFAFGRFAPFYQILYKLPYFSTIRNPIKFAHLVDWALVVLFAYGVNGLWVHYMAVSPSSREGLAGWWSKVKGFDRSWTIGVISALGVAVLGWLIYFSSTSQLQEYLQQVQFDPADAEVIAAFSVRQAGIWLLFFAAAILLLVLAISGTFRGAKARWGAALIGLLVVLDLGRADQPFIVTWDYKLKYATNPILDQLRDKPYLHRVAILPGWLHQMVSAPPQFQTLDQLYKIEWAQHHFLYYDIQSLDLIQMPRMPEDLASFEEALQPRSNEDLKHLVTRRWELTNTRYLLGAAEYVPVLLNPHLDSGKERFKILERFNIEPKPGFQRPEKLEEVTAVPATNGMFAIIEFTGALPRASLYQNWEIQTNSQALLRKLVSPAFDPHRTLLLSEDPGIKPLSSNTNSAGVGSVKFSSYKPKHITLEVETTSPSVLLLNDRHEANWHAYLDGKQVPLLKANFIMRGVSLPTGKHTVELKYEPPVGVLYVSIAAWGVAILLIAGLVVVSRNEVQTPHAVTVPTKA